MRYARYADILLSERRGRRRGDGINRKGLLAHDEVAFRTAHYLDLRTPPTHFQNIHYLKYLTENKSTIHNYLVAEYI